MKAISLWQPWGSLMAVGAKRIETRSWHTAYRGDLAICAAKTWNGDCQYALERGVVVSELFGLYGDPKDMRSRLPFGRVICVVRLTDCVPTETIYSTLTLTEVNFGNYLVGRFAWVTTEVRRLKIPVPVKGYQGLFNLPESVEAEVCRQL